MLPFKPWLPGLERDTVRVAFRRSIGLVLAACLLAPAMGRAAESGATAPLPSAYTRLLSELGALEPDLSRVADVSGVTITRDAGEFVLERGTLVLAKPVNGRIVAAWFGGKGRFRMSPATAVERAELERRYGSPVCDREFECLAMVFADSTAEELAARLAFRPGVFRHLWATSLDNFRNFIVPKSGYLDRSLARTLLEGRRNALFAAVTSVPNGERLRFEIDPFATEEVSLRRVAISEGFGSEPVSQFRLRGEESRGLQADSRPAVEVSRHTMDVRIPGNLRPWFEAELAGTALEDSVRSVAFTLVAVEDRPDSVWSSDGSPLEWAYSRDYAELWIDFGRPLSRGEEFRIRMSYRGPAMEIPAGFPAAEAGTNWYPVHDFKSRAEFDVTFRYPATFALVCVGTCVSRELEGDEVVAHWRTKDPIRNATWQVGHFSEAAVTNPDGPPVRVLLGGEGRKELTVELLRSPGLGMGANRSREVGLDLARSLKFFRHVYGPLAVDTLFAGESRWVHGEAFPGMVALTWRTFQSSDAFGSDEILRAHEAAHQWWGIGVDYASYRDRWLSEGLSEFSALWYLNAKYGKPDLYLQNLGLMRDRILSNGDVGSTWLGHRVGVRGGGETAYGVAVYQRWAWAFHMLRSMLMDLDDSNDDRFTALMREFYATYRGRAATTADFQAIAEKHAGEPLDWFFRQWIVDTRIPTYTFGWTTEPAANGQVKVTLHVRESGVPVEFRMPVPVRIVLPGGQSATLRVWVDKPEVDFDLPLLPTRPQEIVFNDRSAVLCRLVEK